MSEPEDFDKRMLFRGSVEKRSKLWVRNRERRKPFACVSEEKVSSESTTSFLTYDSSLKLFHFNFWDYTLHEVGSDFFVMVYTIPFSSHSTQSSMTMTSWLFRTRFPFPRKWNFGQARHEEGQIWARWEEMEMDPFVLPLL